MYIYCMVPLINNSTSQKLVYNDRKQISGAGEELQSGMRKLLRLRERFVLLTVLTVSWVCTYV